jgi:hypothetical protein
LALLGGIIALPISYFKSGLPAFKEGLVIEGAVLAVALPAWFVGSRKIKYNTKKKWEFKVIQEIDY